MMGGGAQVFVRGGRLMLRVLTPIPALRDLPLHLSTDTITALGVGDDVPSPSGSVALTGQVPAVTSLERRYPLRHRCVNPGERAVSAGRIGLFGTVDARAIAI